MDEAVNPFERIAGLYVRLVPGKGNGVFCQRSIEPDEIIEIAPALVITQPDLGFIDQSFLFNYYFSAKALPDHALVPLGITDKEQAGLLGLGLLSLCNHSDKPNAAVDKQYDRNRATCVLRALRGIEAGEEICISYGAGWKGAAKGFPTKG